MGIGGGNTLEGAEGNRADRGGKAERRKGRFSKVGT